MEEYKNQIRERIDYLMATKVLIDNLLKVEFKKLESVDEFKKKGNANGTTFSNN